MTQIPWSTLVTVIMPKSSSHDEMLWYINAKFVAETTLKKSLVKLGISKYKFMEELPEYLERRLNGK